MSQPEQRYLTDDYVNQNPSWDMEDSPWKAALVTRLLREHHISPSSICEVGCGAGYVLAELRTAYPRAELTGFDIAPAAARFWRQHESKHIDFTVGDFVLLNQRAYDAILVLDVIEHVRDPLKFLSALRGAARHYVFHIPLDLSAISVMRESPLLAVRRRVGHLHYFTKNLALSLVEESGFRIICSNYSGAGISGPRPRRRTWVAAWPRRVVQRMNPDWAVRALGGDTLVVLAQAAHGHGTEPEPSNVS